MNCPICECQTPNGVQAEGYLVEVDKLQQVLKDGAAEYKDAVAKGREVDGLMEDNTRLRKKAEVCSSSSASSEVQCSCAKDLLEIYPRGSSGV